MEQFDFSKLKTVTIYAINRIDIREKGTGNRSNRLLYAFSCKIQGRTVYECNGKRYISDKDHIVLLPKGASYSTSFEELGDCYMIEFDLPDDIVISDIQSIAIPNTLEIQAIFHRMERLWARKKTAYYNKCMSGMYEILACLEEACSVSYRFSSKYSIIAPSVEYMESHYNDSKLSVDSLAAVSGISAVYFRKIFTGIYKMPPAKYLQNLRIEKAKELLISDYPTVGAVTSAVGFRDLYHFCKIFKKVTGCTPSEYAKSAKDKIHRKKSGGRDNDK